MVAHYRVQREYLGVTRALVTRHILRTSSIISDLFCITVELSGQDVKTLHHENVRK